MVLFVHLAVQLLTVIVGATAAVPGGFILEVRSECGSSNTGFANITAITDIPVQAVAVCANGDFLMDVIDSINHVIAAHYTTDADGCVFFRRAKSQTYLVFIHVALDDDRVDFQQIHEHYEVSCTFDSLGSAGTSFHTVHDSHLAPLEIQTNIGDESDSLISIYFLDLADVKYPDNSDIPIMKPVKLVVESDGAGGEAGIQVVSCDAAGVIEGGMRYPMLRAGCGDGLIMQKDVGFVTTGLRAVSVPFTMFHVHKDPVLKIICNVTMCSTTCDGSSCANERIRRHSKQDSQDNSVRTVESTTVVTEWTKPDNNNDVLLTETNKLIAVVAVTCVALVTLTLLLVKCLLTKTDQEGKV